HAPLLVEGHGPDPASRQTPLVGGRLGRGTAAGIARLPAEQGQALQERPARPAQPELHQARLLYSDRPPTPLHRKLARQRQDAARKWARRVVAAFDQIAVEDFKPQFLATSSMAKKAADAAIGGTKRVLVE